MRDRLIGLVDCASREYAEYTAEMFTEGSYGVESMEEYIADYLLKRGVIVSPCKVGQTVYRINTSTHTKLKTIKETTVTRIAIDNDGIWIFTQINPIAKSVWGKTVFLTKEEAEQALSKLQASYEQVKGGAG